jgi:hypothetical protein
LLAAASLALIWPLAAPPTAYQQLAPKRQWDRPPKNTTIQIDFTVLKIEKKEYRQNQKLVLSNWSRGYYKTAFREDKIRRIS